MITELPKGMRIPKVLFNQGTLGKWEPEFESKFDKAVYYAGKSPIPKGKNQQKVSNWFKSLGIKYEDIKEHREKIKDKINELINEEGAWEIFPDVYVPAVSQDFEIGDPEEEDEEVPEGLDDLLGDIKEEPKVDTKTLDIKKFLGEEKYDKYYDELVKDGKIDGQSLSPKERLEGYQTYRKDKINFGKFVEKVLAAKAGVDADTSQKALPTSALVKYDPSKSVPSGDQLKVEKEPSEQREKTDKLLENIVEINKSVTNILSSLKNQNKLFKKGEETDRKQKENLRRKTREEGLEKNKGKIGKIFQSVLKPVESIFSRLKKFIIFTLLGRAFKLLTDFFDNPENEKKIEAIKRFLKDWWPALTALIIGFGTPFGAAVRGLIKIVGGLTFKLLGLIPGMLKKLAMFGIKNPLAVGAAVVAGTGVAAVMANQDDTAVAKDPKKPNKSQADEVREFGGYTGAPISADMLGFEQYNKGGIVPGGGPNKDTVPAMLTPGEFVMSRGAVQNIGVNNLMKMNAAGGGTNRPVVKNASYVNGGGFINKNNLNYSNGSKSIKNIIHANGGGLINKNNTNHIKSSGFINRNNIIHANGGGLINKNNVIQVKKMNVLHANGGGSVNNSFSYNPAVNFMGGYEAPSMSYSESKGKSTQRTTSNSTERTRGIAASMNMDPSKVVPFINNNIKVTAVEGVSKYIPKAKRNKLDSGMELYPSKQKVSVTELPKIRKEVNAPGTVSSGGSEIPNFSIPFTDSQLTNAEIYGIV